MNRMIQTPKLTITASLLTLITACGGGGGGTVETATPSSILNGAAVFQSFKDRATGGYTLVGNTVDDNSSGAYSGCGFQGPETTEYDSLLWDEAIKTGVASITVSTPTKVCIAQTSTSMCLIRFDQFLVSDYRNATSQKIEIRMPPLIANETTVVRIYDDYSSMILSRTRVDTPSNIANCPNLATETISSKHVWESGGGGSGNVLPGQLATAIDGNWAGYKVTYNTSTLSGLSSAASITCTNQVCTVSDAPNTPVALLQQAGGGTWKTAVNAPITSGAAISANRQLLSFFSCTTPLTKSKTADMCSFYTLKR